MKTEKVRRPKQAILLLALLLGPLLARADELVTFGLTNRSINGTALSLTEYGSLHVDDLSTLGYKGLSVRLGEAESGLFFSPQLNQQPADNNFMLASAFGRVGGLDRTICTVSGQRESYGIYPVLVDFTPIGSFSQTYQVFCGDHLVREETNSLGTVTFHTDSSGNLYPRVNPFWRAPDGRVGVLIEISASRISLPHSEAYGDRVFIQAERPLVVVDYLSRVDVFGGGGLPNFESVGEAVGVFNHAHTALGSAVFTARRKSLKVGGLGSGGDDGVMVELNRASAYEMQLAPFVLPTNALAQFSAAGIGYDYTFHGRSFIGPVGFTNNNGTVEVFGTFGGSATNRVRLGVFNDGVFVGGATNEGGVWGTIASGDWKVRSCGARPDSGEDHSSVYVTLDQPVAFQRAGGGAPLTGNQLRFSWHEPGPDNGSFRNFQLQSSGVASFTITNGVFAPPPPQVLTIARAGVAVLVSWPYGDNFSYLEAGYEINGVYSYAYVPGAELVGSHWQTSVPVTTTNQLFFRLNNWCVTYNAGLNNP